MRRKASVLRRLVDRLRPRRPDAAHYAATVSAGTVDDHIGRFRELARRASPR